MKIQSTTVTDEVNSDTEEIAEITDEEPIAIRRRQIEERFEKIFYGMDSKIREKFCKILSDFD